MPMIACIIQARMSSTRLPGKVLKKINGIPLLEYQINRVLKSKLIDKIIVATSISDKDNPIVEFCKEKGIEYFRGSEDDVLGRCYKCAEAYSADIIVRLTADCPLSDPMIIDEVINLYLRSGTDYAGNTVPPETSKYPDGTDVEVFGMNSLRRANKEAKNPYDREHVTFYFWKYYNGFKIAQLDNQNNYSKYRFTVDYPEDFEVVEFIIQRLNQSGSFGHMEEIIGILDSNPDVRSKNSKYYFGIGWKK